MKIAKFLLLLALGANAGVTTCPHELAANFEVVGCAETAQARKPIEGRRFAICLSAPQTKDVDRFCAFVKNRLAKDGFDTVVLLTRYRYAFKSHPECAGGDPLSEADVKKILAACRTSHIQLIPKMNLLGHQDKVPTCLLKAHPDMDESCGNPKIAHDYCRSICPRHPQSFKLVCDLMDEMTTAFESKAIHIGCDEVFEIGKCPRCKDTPTGKLFADWVNGIKRHNDARHIQTMMWGDRLLDSKKVGYGVWEASNNGTFEALKLVDKDLVICDWHYEVCKAYPSVDIFSEARFNFWICPWRYARNAKLFLDYANAHEKGQAIGLMLTTWCGFADYADAVEGKFSPNALKDPKKTLTSLGETYHTFVNARKALR